MSDDKISINERCKKYVEVKDQIKFMREDISNHKLDKGYEDRLSEARRIKREVEREMAEDQKFVEMQDKLKAAKEEAGLLETIILVQMKEQQLTLVDTDDYVFTYEGLEFRIVDKLKTRKVKG